MPLIFKCNYCPNTFPHFKSLVEHYKAKHKGKLKRYEIKNKPLKQVALIYGTTPAEICQALGWNLKNCKVKPIAS